MIRTLIVDDEESARGNLRKYIGAQKEFEILAEAANGMEALQKAKELTPDVVFLDIEMPEMSGLEVAVELSNLSPPPQIVFVTSHNECAVEAFETHAFDYVLKPIIPERIGKTLDRLIELVRGREDVQAKMRALEATLFKTGVFKKIVGHVANSKDRVIVDPEDIDYIYAEGKDVLAKAPNVELFLSMTLKEVAEHLDPAEFIQTHKAYLVNLRKIKQISPLFKQNFQITLNDPSATKIPLSKRYAKALKDVFGTW